MKHLRLIFLLCALHGFIGISAQLLIELPKEGGVNVRSKTMQDFDREGKAPETQHADSVNFRDCLIRGFNALAEKKFEDAKARFENALRLLPNAANRSEIELNIGKINLEEGRTKDALSRFSAILKREPTFRGARFWRIYTYLRLNMPKEAETDANVLLNLPDHTEEQRAKLLYYRAMAKYMERAFVEAQKDIERAMKLTPDDSSLLTFYSILLHKNGRSTEAFDRLNLHLSRFPKDLNALLTRAELQVEEKRYEQALLDYEAALKLAPDHSDIYLSRARIYLAMNKRVMAKKELDTLAKIPGAPRLGIDALTKQ